ncbi:DUF6438 domain-containing protein [uncultured Lacinutrix sp.]|uniref:DUF6438 domain-containing protein n=1 Tax=uncultured Lacinutrix sp. TaxID=574032 RepID=UPI002615F665|nr:DUF6438 domain-containing protein [uncultured Lacinutrix sp.]
MKYIFFILLFTACKNEQNDFIKTEITPTKIDSLNSKEDVEKFVRELEYPLLKIRNNQDSIIYRRVLGKFELKKIIEFDRDSITTIIADSLGITNSFYKADIDNNGYNDLVIIGDDYSVYSLMNFGNDSINPINLIFSRKHNSIVPRIINKKEGALLEIHEPRKYHWKEKRKVSENKKYSLTYLFDNFIEFNNNVKKYDIEKIEYSALGCEGECPIYDLSIDKNKIGKLDAKHYNSTDPNLFEMEISNELKGQFESVISETEFNKLINLLNYLDFPNLNDEYPSETLHTPFCSLKITYNNGKVKTINDSGMIGSYGLKRMYELLSDLRFNQEWN